MTEHMDQTLEEMEEAFLSRLPIERRLSGLSAEERLRGLPLIGAIKFFSDEEIAEAFQARVRPKMSESAERS